MENEMEEDRNEGPPRKRLLTDPNPKRSFVAASPESTVSSDSSSDRVAKKTRELPNLSECHSCAVRINHTNPRERLQPLDSMWRVVLLCKKCTKQVKSSELCPYCFSAVIDDKECFKCRDCQHTIHKDCAAKYDSGLGFSVCVDCWVPDAVATSLGVRKRKIRKNNKESCEEAAATLPESRVSDHETNQPNLSPKISENASEKAMLANNAAEIAQGVSNVAGSCETKVVDNKDLSLMLHRAINAQIRRYSRRPTSKKTSVMNSGDLGVPVIFYTRRRVKGGLKNSVTSNSPLIFYSRRRSSGKSCLHVREGECIIMDKHASSISSPGLKASKCGSNLENSSSGNLKPHRYLLKYHRIGKGISRSSVFDCGSCTDSANLNTEGMSDTRGTGIDEICEECDKNGKRFLLKYKRSVRSKSGFSCEVEEFSPLLTSKFS